MDRRPDQTEKLREFTMAREKLPKLAAVGLLPFIAAVACVFAFPRAASGQAAAYAVLHSFSGEDGAAPRSSLIQAADGNFYGTTAAGGTANLGTVFRMAADGTVTVLHAFTGGPADGAEPLASLIQATDNRFYGTTNSGGIANLGTVFTMTVDGTLTVLHFFTGSPSDGANPQASLVQATDGHFYGTTAEGGTWGVGTAFTMTADGTLTTLHSFSVSEGCYPRAPLIQATDGHFYGTTSAWGFFPFGGTAFTMTVDGAVTVLHYFTSLDDGAGPGGLVQAADGSFYGTSGGGFYHGRGWNGVIFRMTATGELTPLASTMAASQLVQAVDGNFYGTGAFPEVPLGQSSIFRMTPNGTMTLLYSFIGGADGDGPKGGLIRATDGSLYGTASSGGASENGVVFRLTETQPGSMSLNADFDGDGKADLVVYRPNNGGWFIRYSTSHYNYADAGSFEWGVPGDAPLVADFDGDRHSDLVVWRPTNGTWYVRYSSSGYSYANWTSYQWGLPSDTPVAADLDGDGRTDLVVWRPADGTWYVRYSSSNYSYASSTSYQWGLPGDTPLVADVDGDRKSDLVLWRPTTGIWYVRYSSSNYSYMDWRSYQWGVLGDTPIAADLDGDGKSDLVVWRPTTGTWYVRYSSSNYSYADWTSYQWGVVADTPIAADLDGDGRTDLVIWRPSDGTWYVRFSSSNYSYAGWTSYQWGLAADQPL
jgi:uncharacterized repeat protein (TIGR03803 family)